MANKSKRSKPPTSTLTPAVGPNPDGLAEQALAAQRREDDRRKGDTEVEFAPDPAATERRVGARERGAQTAKAAKAAKTTTRTRPAAKRSTATDQGAEAEDNG